MAEQASTTISLDRMIGKTRFIGTVTYANDPAATQAVQEIIAEAILEQLPQMIPRLRADQNRPQTA